MTQATYKRELRLLIEEILENEGIDLTQHPMLAFTLTTAAYSLREEVRQGRTPADAKKRVEDAILRGAIKQLPKMEMGERIERACKSIQFNFFNQPDVEKERLIELCIKDEKNGRTIEGVVTYIFNNDFWRDKISKVQQILDLWYKQENKNVTRNEDGSLYV